MMMAATTRPLATLPRPWLPIARDGLITNLVMWFPQPGKMGPEHMTRSTRVCGRHILRSGRLVQPARPVSAGGALGPGLCGPVSGITVGHSFLGGFWPEQYTQRDQHEHQRQVAPEGSREAQNR